MKTIKRRGAFVQYADETWGIDTKVKVGDTFLHFGKKGYPTLGAAKADFERAKAEFISSRSLNKTQVCIFDELLAEYAKMRALVVNETTVVNCDQSVFRNYFLPTFGGKLLRDCLNQEAIRIWYESLVGNPRLSQNKKQKVITRMKDLLKFAYSRKFMDAVSFQDCDVLLYQVKGKKTAKTERVIWTAEEEYAFMSAIKDKKDYVTFAVFLACGARLGEFLALQPKFFDRDRQRIRIEQQAITLQGKGTYVTDKLKTHDSYRSVILPKAVSDLLCDYIDTLGIADDEFIFFESDRKTPMGRSTFRRRLYRYCDKAGVRRINPHASRHIQATRLAGVCRNGQEIEAAARRLGHSPEMFMNTYAKHTSEETETALLGRLAEA